MKVIIDRFEGAYAVVETEDKQLVNMPRSIVPAVANEGTVISIEIDENETEIRKRIVSDLMKEVFKD